MKRFEYNEVQMRNEVQPQPEVQVQPYRPLTKEEYALYNALPLWHARQKLRAGAKRGRKVL